MTTLETVSRKHHLLLHRLEASRVRYEHLALTVGEAKNRIEVEPEVISVLEELQRREHERAVGAYEELLTLFLRDVLPGHREVVMDLRTERSLPALDIYLRKGEGLPLEDALTGTGGSVTNILSAGLRFIALVRSGKRPFLVLDEPDCWIKPELAPKFAAVVQSVAEQLGVQVLMISHHDEQMFENMLPHRLRLEKNGDNLIANWAPTSSTPDWGPEQAGMRSIELLNFQSHAHTIIPLSPGLTLINGDNDIGKSAIVSALRDVFDASSNDQHIRHGAKSTKVILDFGPDNVLSWERFRKGAQKVVYELRQPGLGLDTEPLHKATSAREVPQWVQDLGIGLIDDMDVQLANQKDPVFLLGESPRDRAKALAIGGENAHVQEMLAIGKQELGDARATVRGGEKELETLHRFRQILEPLEKRTDYIAQMEDDARKQHEARQQDAHLETLLVAWKKARTRRVALGAMETPMPSLPDAPHEDRAAHDLVRRWKAAKSTRMVLDVLATSHFTLQVPEMPVFGVDALLHRWQQAKRRTQALAPLGTSSLPALPEQPVAIDTQLPRRWLRANRQKGALALLLERPMPTLPTLAEDSFRAMDNIGKRWRGSQASAADQSSEVSQLEKALAQVRQDMEAMGECPTCGRPLGHDHSLREDVSP